MTIKTKKFQKSATALVPTNPDFGHCIVMSKNKQNKLHY